MDNMKKNEKALNELIEDINKDNGFGFGGDEMPNMDKLLDMFSMFGNAQKPYVKFIKTNDKAILPKYQTPGSSGFDLHTPEAFVIHNGECKMIDTGLKLADISPGMEIQVRSRSGLAAKNQIFVLNTPGTVDNDYRNSIKVILYNLGPEKSFNEGDRICQCVVQRVEQVDLDWTTEEELKATERGEGGIGSTGS